MEAGQASKKASGKMNSLAFSETGVDLDLVDVQSSRPGGKGYFSRLTSGCPAQLRKKDDATHSVGPMEDQNCLDDDPTSRELVARKRKFFGENKYREEDNSSSYLKHHRSTDSSESGADQIPLRCAPSDSPKPTEIVHSVRGSDAVLGKRKRIDPTLGYAPPLSTPTAMGPLSSRGVSTPASCSVGSIFGIRSTSPSEEPDVIVIDDAEEQGGIFDDADEDLGFDFPTYSPLTAPAGHKSHIKPTKMAVTEERVKKRRAPHQLNGKKETETAGALLAGKDDLLQVLPSDDCYFLAKNLWIFTVQQLEATLDPSNVEEQAPGRDPRKELLHAVAGNVSLEDTERAFSKKPPDSDPENGIESDASVPNSDLDDSDPPLISLKQGTARTSPRAPSPIHTIDANLMRAAEARLKSWASSLSNWRKTATDENSPSGDDKFPLDGPISCLLPVGLQNFLATLKIFTLAQFFSLRKTESGMVTVAFRKWRSICNLSVVPDVLLSKHLLGVTSRVEMAVTSVPCADHYTRKWMGSELVVLTGAARDFIVDECKIYDPEDFVSQKTKGLADQLEKWRETKNMPPLKGTGKVAMISGWKTNVKEELVIARAEGETIHDIDLLELAEMDCRDESESRTSKKKEKADLASKKQPGGERCPRVESALRSTQFLKKVLGLEKSSILIAAGIDTAEKLFDADKHTSSALVQKMVEARKSSTFPGSTQPASNMRLLYDWTTKLRGKLEEMKEVRENKIKTKAPKSPGRPSTKDTNEGGERARIEPSRRKDPVDALSATARTFLATQGISSAKDLLTTRTTDIANAFVPWREANDLPVLKGLGAIASVSGWKATVRKASLEMGLPDIADAGPKQTASTTIAEIPPRKTELRPNTAHIEPMTHPELLFGKASCRFAVRSCRGTPMVYIFQLSVRHSNVDQRDETIFLTFLGTRKVGNDTGTAEQKEDSDDCFRKERWDSRFNPVLPVLLEEDVDTPNNELVDQAILESCGPFSSHRSGCGIIELSKYGAFPQCRNQERRKHLLSLKSEISKFLDLVIEAASHGSRSASAVGDQRGNGRRWRGALNTTNAFVRSSMSNEARCFAYLKDPIERGQVVELMFGSPLSLVVSDQSHLPAAISQRLRIADAVCSLAYDDVARALNYLEDEILHEVNNELWEAMGPRVNYPRASIALRKRRRLHWITSFLLRYGSPGTPLSHTLRNARNLSAGKLLWDCEILSKLDSLSETSKNELLKILKADMENEILFEVAASGSINLFSCDSLLSFVADECLRRSLEVVLCHLTKQDAEYTMSNFLSELSGVVSNIVSLVVSEGSFLSTDLELSRRPIGMVVALAEGHDIKEDQEVADGKCFAEKIAIPEESVGDQEALGGQKSLSCGFAAELPSSDRRSEGQTDVSDFPKMVLVTREDLISGQASLNKRWYIENQVLFVTHAVVTAAMSQWPQIDEAYSFTELRDAAYQAAQESSPLPLQEDESLSSDDFLDVRLFVPSGKFPVLYEPHPLPIFLGTLWPKLSKLGWRLEMGNVPDRFSFLPPGQASSNRKAKDARVKQMKQVRARRRAKLAKEASETGLGYIPKLMKHLLANSVQVDARESYDDEEIEGGCSVTVALKKFESMVRADLDPDDTHGKSQLHIIVGQIRECFNELSPRLVLNDETNQCDETPDEDPSDVFGCEYLMRFLLILPGILYEASVPTEQLQDTLAVVKELLNFLAENHKVLFDKCFRPPKEELQIEEFVEPFLAPKLKKLSAKEGDDDDDVDTAPGSTNKAILIEGADVIVLPTDRPDLTDFVSLVMSQLILCRATVDDAGKKNRRILAGHPGLLCRHCKGDGGEGRYFFSTVESLTTAATVIEKHISRCPKIPEDIKSRMLQYRAKHTEQRLTLQSGSLGAYYARLFDRLISSKNGGDTSVYVKPPAESFKDEPVSSVSSLSGADDAGGAAVIEFHSHVHVLEYIKSMGQWHNRKEVMEGMEEYYKCLEYGGSVFCTSAMPAQFSAEWVLAKVGPRGKNRFQKSD